MLKTYKVIYKTSDDTEKVAYQAEAENAINFLDKAENHSEFVKDLIMSELDYKVFITENDKKIEW
jgi:hypothetical protein